jgi:hypothetical protein
MSPEDRISKAISEFDAQGFHRTGTEVDAASARWLADLLDEAGVLASVETYRFRRLVPHESFVEVGTERIEGLPMFDAPPTPPDGVAAPLGDGPSEIALRPAVPGRWREIENARVSAGAAVVVPTTGARAGLAPINAEAFRAPFGQPVLQVWGGALPALQAAAEARRSVRVVSCSHVEDTVTSNVTGVVPGMEPALPPVCVMTPRSGWWECASERGGGIACLLEVARAIAVAKPRRTVLFVSTTGHELGHWGLEEFLLRRPGLDRGALLWLHFGASIGAALEPRPMLYASRPALADEALAALTSSGAKLPTLPPPGTVGAGESKNVHAAGGQYISMAGTSAVFHLAADRWPEAVDVAQVAAVARGMSGLAVRAANS